MKIAQMTGAYVNAGDFLIQERANALLRYAFPSAEIKIFQAKEDAISRFDEINKCDAIIVEGGPYIVEDISHDLPIETYMLFQPPIMFLGVGQYLKDGSKDTNYKIQFTPSTLALLKKVTQTGYGISCRDLYTYRALKKENLSNIYMTGCPAWYRLSHIDEACLRNKGEIRHICVSDPAKQYNYQQVNEVLKYVYDKYPQARITYVVHRDANEEHLAAIRNRFPHVEIAIINGSADGFIVYDECDLHIGYRVHAHIYNLSIRNRSILIEEDARGAGVNEALGLIRITAYDDTTKRASCDWSFNRNCRKNEPRNKHIIQEISAYVDICEQIDWQNMSNAFSLMRTYYRKMMMFVNKIGETPQEITELEDLAGGGVKC